MRLFARAPRALLLTALLLSIAAADSESQKTLDLIDAGRYEEALGAARERLAGVEAASGPDAPEVARAIALVLKAGYWSSRPKDPELLALARRAVAIDERASGPDGSAAADSLLGLATILIARGDIDEAKGICERALVIREREFGPQSLEAAASRRWLGIVFEEMGDLHRAAAEQGRVLTVQETLLAPDDREIASTLNSLASVQRQLGDYPHAVESRQRCLAIREKAFGPDHPQVAWAAHNLANLYADLGEFAKARELYARALAIRERTEPPDHPDLGYSHNSLGVMAYNLGDYGAARAEYERALGIREKSLGADHALVAATLNNLGNLLDEMGEVEKARDVLSRALQIKTRKLGPDHVSTAITANNLGNVLAKLGEFDRAEALTRRALAIREKTLGADHADVGRSLDDLGWIRHLRDDDAGGIPSLTRALDVREKALSADHPDVAETLERLAIVTSGAGEPAAALPLAARALDIQRRTLGADHPTVAGTLALIGEIDLKLGRAGDALASALESESIGREHFRLTARHLAQREALRYEEVRASGLDVALQALTRMAGDPAVAARAGAVLDDVIRSRALVLDAIGSRRRLAAEARTDEASRRISALRDAATAFARLARREPDPDHPDRYLTQLREARERKERTERDLIEISAAEREWSDAGRVGLADVRAALPEGAVLLSYVRYTSRAPSEERYVAFVTAGVKNSTTAAVSLGPASRIDGLVARWKTEAGRGAQAPSVALRRLEGDYRDSARALRKAIWDPVAANVRDATLLFVVLDGALDVVNLAAFPAEDDRYLVETGPLIAYLSAERDLVSATRPRDAGSGILVVGAVDYGVAPASTAGGPCSPFHALRFGPLPGARDEADSIARIFTSRGGIVTRLSGADATARRFLAAAPSHEILHVATHGFFLDDTCDRRGATGSRNDPMLLSGLAFAGANQRRDDKPQTDDGLLTAEEIASLDLSRVAWAVLSACNTGLGEIRNGEGVLGLRRAFQIAGAGTLIMSLWTVRDEDASEWMRGLYDARLAKLDTAHAIRNVSMRMLEARRKEGRSTHPAAWGAFVAFGAWR
ncbi:MAG: CHAT domain-containing protein [Acidobacteria bacterium]|nr:CHAT domain-containing protein [Acidobacteriota bacterium]